MMLVAAAITMPPYAAFRHYAAVSLRCFRHFHATIFAAFHAIFITPLIFRYADYWLFTTLRHITCHIDFLHYFAIAAAASADAISYFARCHAAMLMLRYAMPALLLPMLLLLMLLRYAADDADITLLFVI